MLYDPSLSGHVHEGLRDPEQLVEALAVGTRVAVGERVATLRVLDETLDLMADVDGIVAAHPSQPGALLDYGASAVVLEKAA